MRYEIISRQGYEVYSHGKYWRWEKTASKLTQLRKDNPGVTFYIETPWWFR